MNLLLLPGLLCDAGVWAPVLPHVEALADCGVPEYAEATSLRAMAERVLAGAPATFALAGHSMGGRVALEIVRVAPERVSRLALLDTGCRARPAGAAGDDETARRLALLAIGHGQGMRAMGEAMLPMMVHPDRLADQALIAAILAMFERQTPERAALQIEALLAREDATTAIGRFAGPALVVCGREDRVSPLPQNLELSALASGSRLVIVEDCGHMAPMERPDAVGAALAEWMRATPVSSAPRQSERLRPTRDMIA